MAKLYVVRHAAVHVDYNVPSASWTLTDEGPAASPHAHF